MADEDYTTYTKVDENGDLTVIASKVDFVTMRRDTDACIYKSMGAGHFDGDFSIYQEHNITGNVQASAYTFLASICDNAGNLGTVGKSLVTTRDTSANRPVIADVDDVGNVDMSAAGSNLSQDTLYYDDFNRVTNTLTWDIYSDTDRTSLVQSISGTIINTTYTYEYMFALSSRNESSSASVTGLVQNLNLNEAAAGTDYDKKFSDDTTVSDLDNASRDWITQFLANNIDLDDLATLGRLRAAAFADGLDMAESITLSRFRTALLSDGISLVESISLLRALSFKVIDPLDVTDNVDTVRDFTKPFADDVDLSDNTSIGRYLATLFTDNLPMFDSFSIVNAWSKQFENSLPLNDTVLTVVQALKQYTDDVELFDSFIVDLFAVGAVKKAFLDAVPVNDTLISTTEYYRIVFDILTVSDTLTATRTNIRALLSIVSTTDALFKGVERVRVFTDALGITDQLISDAVQKIVKRFIDELTISDALRADVIADVTNAIIRMYLRRDTAQLSLTDEPVEMELADFTTIMRLTE